MPDQATPSKAMTTESTSTPKEPETQQERLNFLNARREGAVLFDETIVAKPMTIPGARIKPKDSNMVLYWANASAGGGRRVGILQLKGFRIARLVDLKDGHMMTEVNGQIKEFDTLLMIAPKAVYYGQLKHNAQVAQQRLSKSSVLETGRRQVGRALNEVSGPQSQKSKIQPFIPGHDEVSFTSDLEPGEVSLSSLGH